MIIDCHLHVKGGDVLDSNDEQRGFILGKNIARFLELNI